MGKRLTTPSKSGPASSTILQPFFWWQRFPIIPFGLELARQYSWLLFLFYAPFWETLVVGQINAFVLLALAVTLVASLRNRQVMAGAALGVAIVLKTSPALLLLHLLLARQWRAIIAALAAVCLLTLLALVLFGEEVVVEFIRVTLQTAGTPTANRFNLSVEALLSHFVSVDAGAWIARGLMLGALALTVLRLRHQSEMLFAALVVVMTAFSPIMWYHHAVFLLVPLYVLLARRSAAAWVAFILIQSERLFDMRMPLELAGLPTIAAETLLFVWLCRRTKPINP